MNRIAIFGGTFNPIHNGHLHIAQQFEKQLHVQRLLFIPTFVPPHKQISDLAPAEDRLEMCRLACLGTSYEVSDLEIRRGGPSYTADTLAELKQNNPGTELYFITGEDMFLTLELHAYAKRLAAHGARVILLNIDYLPVSSTMVRDAVRQGRSIDALVPPRVAHYIQENGLYQRN